MGGVITSPVLKTRAEMDVQFISSLEMSGGTGAHSMSPQHLILPFQQDVKVRLEYQSNLPLNNQKIIESSMVLGSIVPGDIRMRQTIALSSFSGYGGIKPSLSDE